MRNLGQAAAFHICIDLGCIMISGLMIEETDQADVQSKVPGHLEIFKKKREFEK